MTGGLGRSLADIRRDLTDSRAHHHPLFGDLTRILEGADASRPAEFGEMTPGQLWARLLESTPENRLGILAGLLAAAGDGNACKRQDHEGRSRLLWAIGRQRAHLMEWDDRAANGGPHWRSPCGYKVRRYYPGMGHAAAHGDPPTRPWCSSCLRIAQRRVNGYLAAGVAVRSLPGLEGEGTSRAR